MAGIEQPKCLLGSERERAEQRVLELLAVPFLLDGDAMEFLEHCNKQTHIHWPELWGTKIDEIYERVI